MAGGGLPKNIRRIRELAAKQASTITLGQLLRSTRSDPESRMRQGRWLHETLPVRFARRLDDFMQLPYAAVQNARFTDVMERYLETLDTMCAFPRIITLRDEAKFCDLLSEQLGKHSSMVPTISEGYWEIRQLYPHVVLDAFLNNLMTTRISTRILIEHYINMRNPQEDNAGVVQHLSPLAIIQDKSRALTRLTRKLYGVAPELEFRGNLGLTLDYIPRHLGFMVQEVLKNALRSTVERHVPKRKGERAVIPPVAIELQKGDVYVIVKISDQGGGMPKRMQKEAWQYGWTTVSEGGEVTLDPSTWPGQQAQKRNRELAGYGFGLPLTRLYAQFFGGEVFLQALPGHGTDVYLLLNHLHEGAASLDVDDPSTLLTVDENHSHKATP